MPYRVANGAIMEIAIRGRLQGQRTISLFHFKLEMESGDLDGSTTIQAADTEFNNTGGGQYLQRYLETVSRDLTLEEISYQWLYPTRRAREVRVPSAAVGLVEQDSLPANLAFAITKHTDLAGRKGVGTLHMPAVPKTYLDGGEWTLLGVESYGNLLTKLATSLPIEFGISLVPVLFHRAAPADSPEILRCNSNFTVRTMHRRTVGVGE